MNGKNIQFTYSAFTPGSAITLIPLFSANSYTATFITNSNTTLTSAGYTKNGNIYTKTYRSDALFEFPNVEVSEGLVFAGWEVQDASDDASWRIGDRYTEGETKREYYGDVTFISICGELSFTQSSITKTYGDANFINGIRNTTGSEPEFTSTDIGVVQVDSLGVVTIVGHGTANIVATIRGVVSVSYSVTINTCSISGGILTVSPTSYVYSGNANQPTTSLNVGGRKLVLNTDYTVTYTSNINVGTATVQANGINNYKDTISTTFTITNATITGSISQNGTLTYTGSAQAPLITNNLKSVANQAITVTYSTSNNGTYSASLPTFTNAGTHIIYFKAIAPNHNTLSSSFTIIIDALNILENNIDLAFSTAVYTGEQMKPAVTVIVDGKTLSNVDDYTVTYVDNTDVGTASVKITGNGNYLGDITKKFTITNASIAGNIGQNGTLTYTGSPQVPALTNTFTTVDGTPINLTFSLSSGGTYTADLPTITAAGTYTYFYKAVASNHNSITHKFSVVMNARTISDGTITLSSNSYTYDGAAKTPTTTLVVGGQTLTLNTDYTIAYSNNTNAGQAKVILTGKTNYTGSIEKNFTISAKDLSSGALTLSPTSVMYTGSAQSVGTTVILDGVTLVNNTDYTTAYTNNTAVGTATATITGKANYTGSLSKTFIINGDIEDAVITLGTTSYVYDGNAKQPLVVVDYGGNTLTGGGTHYTVEYANNINVGTASVTITGVAPYLNSKTINFAITNATITGTITQSGTLTYNGNAQTPSISNSLSSVNNQTISVTYSTSSDGTYASNLPTFTNAGSHSVYYKATAANHAALSSSFTVTINKANMSAPTNLTWSAGTASWSAVTGATTYAVKLYNGSTLVYSNTGISSTSLNFTSYMTSDSSSWKFTVNAEANTNYNASSASTSGTTTTYTVAFNANGGNSAPSTQVKFYGVTLVITSSTPYRDYYDFKGWGTSSSTSTVSYSAGSNYTSNSSTTLYAVWSATQNITISVVDTSGYYYYNGSIYYSSGNSYTYNCSYCGGSSTSSSYHSSSCSSRSYYGTHNQTSSSWKCTWCGSIASTCYHTPSTSCGTCGGDGKVNGTGSCGTCGGDGSVSCSNCGGDGEVSCGTCGGDGYTNGTLGEYSCKGCGGDGVLHTFGDNSGRGWNGCSSCGGSGGTRGSGTASCGTCSGSGSVTTSVSCTNCGGDGLVAGTSADYATTRVYKCGYCNSWLTSTSGTCYSNINYYNHSGSTTTHYLYTRYYGSGNESLSFTSQLTTTGYYWHDSYGAMTVGTTFTFAGNSNRYKITSFSGSTAYATLY